MPVVCPKCSHEREADAQVPDWQCPACGVVYAKALRAQQGESTEDEPPLVIEYRPASSAPQVPAGVWLLLAVVLFGAWASFSTGPSRFGGSHSNESLSALAATVGSEDILMYGFESCPACRQARGWMDHHGFPYEICDIQRSTACAQQLAGYGQNAVPYFVIRGERMLGLDENAFVAALQH
jgi:glutaredoxin